jgi:hypothetical protein
MNRGQIAPSMLPLRNLFSCKYLNYTEVNKVSFSHKFSQKVGPTQEFFPTFYLPQAASLAVLHDALKELHPWFQKVHPLFLDSGFEMVL